MIRRVAGLWLDGIVHWRVPKAVQTERQVGLAIIVVAAALLAPTALGWPPWAQISSGVVLVLLVGLLNGACRTAGK